MRLKKQFWKCFPAYPFPQGLVCQFAMKKNGKSRERKIGIQAPLWRHDRQRIPFILKIINHGVTRRRRGDFQVLSYLNVTVTFPLPFKFNPHWSEEFSFENRNNSYFQLGWKSQGTLSFKWNLQIHKPLDNSSHFVDNKTSCQKGFFSLLSTWIYITYMGRYNPPDWGFENGAKHKVNDKDGKQGGNKKLK